VFAWVVIRYLIPDQTGIVFASLVLARKIGDLLRSRVKYPRWKRGKIFNAMPWHNITSVML